MNIVLIGYRCTGKSSVGRLLSEKLGWDFIDTDELVEKRAGMKIEDIVLRKGWDEFRRIEKIVVKEVSNTDNTVIATGGGVVLDQENVRYLKKNGWIIWLKASPEIIKKRMLKDKNIRPSLTGKDPVAEIKEVLDIRMPFYKEASNFSIETDFLSQEKICDIILEKLKDAW